MGFEQFPQPIDNPETDKSSAERRKERAEEKDEISISHWRGDLHAHTRTDISSPESPEDIIEHRKGSNCGKIPLEVFGKNPYKTLVSTILSSRSNLAWHSGHFILPIFGSRTPEQNGQSM